MPKPLITAPKTLSKKEYYHHRAHAIVGLYVICHFVYRYAIFFMDKDTDMGFNNTLVKSVACARIRTLYFSLVFFPHALLQMSGFGFEIPRKRHPDGNRIWPQYRIEALVFFGRCMSLLFLAWYRKGNNRAVEKSQHAAFIIVFCTMILADTIKHHYKKMGDGSRTIRDLHGQPGVLYMMSSTQFHATLHSLMTSDRLCVQIAALAIVQLSAFGMTLRRKGLITQPQGLILYGLVLVLGMIIILSDLYSQGILFLAISFGNIAALVRFECAMNKYILWTMVTVVLQYILQIGQHIQKTPQPDKDHKWLLISIVSTAALFIGAYNRQHKYKKT